MGGLDAMLFLFPWPALRRRAMPLLRRELGVRRADALWNEVRVHQRGLKPLRPKHSPGVDLLVRYMELDVALYRSLIAAGVTRSRAGELVQALNWQVFGPIVAVSHAVARLRSRRTLRRCQWILDLMFAVIFSSPFERRKHPATDHIAFDVTSCPLADYFRAQGVPELTRHAACSLDHEMARLWGVELRRTGTIADGAPLCDFRFYLAGGDAAAQGTAGGQ